MKISPRRPGPRCADRNALRDSLPLFDNTGNRYSWGHEIFFADDRAFVIAQSETGFYYEEPFLDDVAIAEPVEAEPVDPPDTVAEPVVVDAEPDVVDAEDVVETDIGEDEPVDAEAGFAPPAEGETEPIPVEPDMPK